MKAYLCGGTAAFQHFVKNLLAAGDTLEIYASPDQLPLDGEGGEHVYFLLPDYQHNHRFLPEMAFDRITRLIELKNSGARFYVENYLAQDYLHPTLSGFQITGRERFLFQEYLVDQDHILQARNSYYFPSVKVASPGAVNVSNCIGTHRVFKPGTYNLPVLARLDNSQVVAAAMNLSDCDLRYMRPRREWKRLYAETFAAVTGKTEADVADAFDRSFPEVIRLAGGRDSATAVRKALAWHRHSGLFRAADGSQGMFEMIRSNDLGIRANLRTDSCLLTGALFALVGKHFQSPELVRIGCNLADFLLKRGIQHPSGLFKWFDNRATVWASDTSRDGLAMLALDKATGENRYREAARRLGDGLRQWLGADGLCCGTFNPEIGWAGRPVNDNPVYYGEMVSFLLQLHEDNCTAAALAIIDRIRRRFPAVAPFGFSDNFTWSRYLLMLACAQHQTDRDFSADINRALDFFHDLQDPSGGIREAAIRLHAHTEAGVGIGDDSDHIADLLYCNNYVFGALSVLRQLPRPGKINQERVEELYQNLRAFLLRIQIDSDDPRLHGGWMRSFDMDLDEYYGLNKDMDWGPYCIMAGWVTGIIPAVLLNELGAPSFFV